MARTFQTRWLLWGLLLVFPTLVIGAQGFIGHHLHRFFKRDGTHHQPQSGYFHCNLEDPKLEFPLIGYRYAVIAAAIADCRVCEEKPEYTWQINVHNTLLLAEQLIEQEIIPIFLSTDYVFDGNLGNYTATSPCNPLNMYGMQKRELEERALKNLPGCLVIRLSKVFGTQRGDGTLIDSIASQLSRGTPVQAADDQIFSPIAIEDVVWGIHQLQTHGKTGLFQFAGFEKISRYQLAYQIAVRLKKEDLVQKISITELHDVVRPKNTTMISDVQTRSLSTSIERIVEQYVI